MRGNFLFFYNICFVVGRGALKTLCKRPCSSIRVVWWILMYYMYLFRAVGMWVTESDLSFFTGLEMYSCQMEYEKCYFFGTGISGEKLIYNLFFHHKKIDMQMNVIYLRGERFRKSSRGLQLQCKIGICKKKNLQILPLKI